MPIVMAEKVVSETKLPLEDPLTGYAFEYSMVVVSDYFNKFGTALEGGQKGQLRLISITTEAVLVKEDDCSVTVRVNGYGHPMSLRDECKKFAPTQNFHLDLELCRFDEVTEDFTIFRAFKKHSNKNAKTPVFSVAIVSRGLYKLIKRELGL